MALRGFAAMTPERRKEVARAGGRAARDLGVAHRWTSEEATAAGHLGGLETRRRYRTRRPPADPMHPEPDALDE